MAKAHRGSISVSGNLVDRVIESPDHWVIEMQKPRFEDFLPLVSIISRCLRYRLPACVEYDDLFQDGCIGLLSALASYRPEKGKSLRNWAKLRIRGAIFDGLRDRSDISRDDIRKRKRLRATYQKLTQKLGRGPTDCEIARSLGITLHHFHKILPVAGGLPQRIITARRNERREFLDDPIDSRADPFESCLLGERLRLLARLSRGLAPRERAIIFWRLRFGFTAKEIAESLGLDESRISQLLRKIIFKLLPFFPGN